MALVLNKSEMNLSKMKINKRTSNSYVEKALDLESFALVLILWLKYCVTLGKLAIF